MICIYWTLTGVLSRKGWTPSHLYGMINCSAMYCDLAQVPSDRGTWLRRSEKKRIVGASANRKAPTTSRWRGLPPFYLLASFYLPSHPWVLRDSSTVCLGQTSAHSKDFTFLDPPHGIQEATGYEPNYGSNAYKALDPLSTPAIAISSPSTPSTGSSHWHCQCLNFTVFTGSLQSTGLNGWVPFCLLCLSHSHHYLLLFSCCGSMH